MPLQTLSLSQQQRQMMILAPQLRQSLEMLQMPILELRAVVQHEMEHNPAIEDVTTDEVSVDAETPADATEIDAEQRQEMDFDKDFEVLARIDDEWRDYFFQNLQNSSYSSDDDERRQYMFDSVRQEKSLSEHLLEQLALTDLPDDDLRIGEMIVGSINDDGYLTSSLPDLASQTGAPIEHLEELLGIIQEFHPTGVGARDLRECLLLQVERLAADPETLLAADIVRDHLEALGAHKFPTIARALGATVEKVQEAAQLVRTLDPRPGRIFSDDTAGYVTPEVIVDLLNGRYIVVVDDDQLPHVRISRHYRKLMADPNTTQEVRAYIRERVRAGAFLIKSIHQRQKTIHRIASEIVESQQEFLEHGISHLRPMTMADVAQRVGVHETTVSRTVANKYMRTPRGIFEMKYFFTPGLRRDNGEAISNQTIKDRIARMVQQEDSTVPLSDLAIQKRLKAEGIDVARRTVAKYRLMLRLPPSTMRRKY